MKKGVLVLLVFLATIFYVAAEPCELDVTLVNQDPYPAQPNNYVEVVFQMSGVENPDCRGITFEITEKFPFKVEAENKKTLEGSTYTRDYKSEWVIPYRLFVSPDAEDNNEELEVRFTSDRSPNTISKKFNISVEDSIADFEVHIKEYSYAEESITFEILNIADVDVEAVVLEISKQGTIKIDGSNRNIVGDINSNEYTTASFDALPQDGEIELTLFYNDQVGVRRQIQKSVNFDSAYFLSTKKTQSTSPITYILVILIVGGIIWFFFKKKRKKERLAKKGLHKL